MRFKEKLIDILGKIYKLKFLEDSKFEDQDYGLINFNTMEIQINIDKGLDHQKDTLIHEMIHAIDSDLGIGLTERQVRQLGCGIFQVLKTNKKLRLWLFTERRKLNG
jgi:peptide deformylase